MTHCTRWKDLRAGHVERADGESAVATGKDEQLATVRGHRLAEIRRSRSLTQQEIVERMGITKGRISQIGQAVAPDTMSSRYAAALYGTLHQEVCVNDGDIAWHA